MKRKLVLGFVIAVLAVSGYFFAVRRVTRANWDGARFTCPAGRSLWADEGEALAGHSDYVYCIPEVRQ